MYITVPKDFVNDIESKAIFNLTKRQLICFSLGIIISLPVFFLFRNINTSLAMLGMMLVASPFFIGGIFKKNNQYLEKYIKLIYNVKFGGKPQKRLYTTNNYYVQLEKQCNFSPPFIFVYSP